MYRLKCQTCQLKYIGQTWRLFETWFKEHTGHGKQNNVCPTYIKHQTLVWPARQHYRYPTSCQERCKKICTHKTIKQGQHLSYTFQVYTILSLILSKFKNLRLQHFTFSLPTIHNLPYTHSCRKLPIQDTSLCGIPLSL
jgi:hypothetical protein